MAFRFDTEWTFQNAVFRGFFHHDDEDMAEYDQYRQDRMIIVTTDEAEVAAFLDHEFQRAVEQNQEEAP